MSFCRTFHISTMTKSEFGKFVCTSTGHHNKDILDHILALLLISPHGPVTHPLIMPLQLRGGESLYQSNYAIPSRVFWSGETPILSAKDAIANMSCAANLLSCCSAIAKRCRNCIQGEGTCTSFHTKTIVQLPIEDAVQFVKSIQVMQRLWPNLVFYEVNLDVQLVWNRHITYSTTYPMDAVGDCIEGISDPEENHCYCFDISVFDIDTMQQMNFLCNSMERSFQITGLTISKVSDGYAWARLTNVFALGIFSQLRRFSLQSSCAQTLPVLPQNTLKHLCLDCPWFEGPLNLCDYHTLETLQLSNCERLELVDASECGNLRTVQTRDCHLLHRSYAVRHFHDDVPRGVLLNGVVRQQDRWESELKDENGTVVWERQVKVFTPLTLPHRRRIAGSDDDECETDQLQVVDLLWSRV